MQFSTLLLAALPATTLALPSLINRDAQCTNIMYGSLGTVTFKGFSNEPGAATCNSVAAAPPPGTAVVRLPAAYMNAAGVNRCGKTVTVYFTPRIDGGLEEAPALTSMQATVYGTCVSCQSWEAEGSPEIFDKVWPGGDSATGTWGPSIVFN